MCKICDKWDSGEIGAEGAMDLIKNQFLNASQKQSDHLMDLSSRILDAEVPLADTNEEADKAWWESHHPTREE